MIPRYFNINQNVYVRLTDHGRRILEHKWNVCYNGKLPYVAPVEDNEGWSQWQMHELIHQLGSYCYNGGEVPFETTIKFDKADILGYG